MTAGTAVRVAAPAKVNLCLGVGPVRPDGYHPLATVYLAVDLRDELLVAESTGASSLTVRGGALDLSAVPLGPENLVLRAAALLTEQCGRPLPVDVELVKRIPVAGGLAGGSADAAATLFGVDALYDLRTSRATLLELAARLGSDVPFCIVGGAACGSGRGELVEPLETRGTFWWVVVPDASGLSTPAVYAEFDRLHAGRSVADPVIPDDLVAALATGDAPLLGASLRNDLERAALSLRPDLREVLDAGRAGSDQVPGALGALVSGSGPTTVHLAADEHHARRLAGHLQDALGRRGATAPFVVSSPAPGATRLPGIEGPVPSPGRGAP